MEFEPDNYALDAALIVEDDAHMLDRLAPYLDQIDADEDEIGAVIQQNRSLIHRLPNGAGLLAQFARNRANKGKLVRGVRKMVAKQPARKMACDPVHVPRAFKVSRKDLVGRVQTPTPLFAALDFKLGALSGSIKGMSGQNIRVVKAFHKGMDDDGAPYGSDTPIDSHRTNLITGGALPDGSTFLCHGIDVEVVTLDRSEMNPADLRVFGDAQLRWAERNGQNSVQLSRIAECPSTRGIITAAGGGDERGVRYAGQPFRSKAPLFSLRGGEKGHEMQIEFPDPELDLIKPCRIRISLIGRHFQRQAGS